MKIAYIVNVRMPTEKAHGLQIMKACEAFANIGAEVALYVSDRQTLIKKNEFDYYQVNKIFTVTRIRSIDIFKFEKTLGKVCFWTQALSFLYNLNKIKLKKDVVIYTRNIEIAWLFSIKKYKVVYEAHAWPSSKIKTLNYLLKKVSFIVCNSKGTQQKFVEHNYKNTIAVPNGVDLERFSNIKSDDSIRDSLELGNANKIIMYTGHLYEWKGVDVIIETAKLLNNQVEYKFVLIGGTEKDYLKYSDIIKNNQLNNVKLIKHCEPYLIPAYLALADVLLLPNVPTSEESVNFTSPLKLFEYMATGKPIVASKLPSICEILNDSNSILVEPNSPVDLLRGINLALNIELVEKITVQALSDVSDYTWIKRAQKIISFVNKS